jgi:nicotinamidase-related amidase
MQALLLIDIQNGYFPGGKVNLGGSEAAGAKAGKLLATFRKRGKPVFHVQHITTRESTSFFLPGTDGVHIHHSVQPLPDEKIIVKHHASGFQDTDLQQELESKGITELVIAGMMTQMCVDKTARDAFALGFQCTLAHDACATRGQSVNGKELSAQEVQESYLAALDGIYAHVLDTDTICSKV